MTTKPEVFCPSCKLPKRMIHPDYPKPLCGNRQCPNFRSIPAEVKHTPTPWKAVKCPCKHPGCFKYMLPDVCNSGHFEKEDVDFIIRAVNSHEELLNACKRMIKAIAHNIEGDALAFELVEMREAIAKAEGK